MKRAHVDDHDSYRAAGAALVAIFCAHVFAVLVTAPPQRPQHRGHKRIIAARTRDERGSRLVVRATRAGAKSLDIEPPAVRPEPNNKTEGEKKRSDDLLAPYAGLGSWVDLFNRGPWRNPSWTVRKMHKRGVRTIFLQTSTYGSSAPIVYPRKVAEFIASAHRRGMYVVGWSVPSFKWWRRDTRRAVAAIRFRTGKGERFDSFGLDIEADIIRSIVKRNHRLFMISERIREVAGSDYPLGAIIPDPGYQRYWPDFPYKRIAARYDVMVPMSYWTFQTHGYRNVRDYTATNIRVIRRETGNSKTPIHHIGGIADEVGPPAARGWIRAIKEHKVLGGSLYDYPITSEDTWQELAAVPAAPQKFRPRR